MIIREACLDDLSNIANLHAQSWRDNYSDVLSEEYLEKSVFADRTSVWTSRLKKPLTNQLLLVAELDDYICGFICAFGDHHPTFGTIIDNLHVKSGNKGKGIGRQLLAAAASWATTHYKNTDLYLEVLESNTKAIRFYEALGAKNIGSSYWHTPCGNQAKEFIYSWGLPEVLVEKLQLSK
ncbi:MAG: GNAT family N-acetyltransferase [Oceanospirillaceae bacterium]|nr:GNAT family N-acetyltransferase [Oceanospirillaceae bacterium]